MKEAALKEQIKKEILEELQQAKQSKKEAKEQKKKEKKEQKEKTELTEKVQESHGLYYTKSEPRKSFSTFMRNQNKFYLNSFNIIDRKAAIMIRVNATIISGIVILFQYMQNIPYGTYIALVMVVSSFISLMFAINASRPHFYSLGKRFRSMVASKHQNLEELIYGVGMFDQVSIEEYEAAYNKLLNSQELQIGNQVRTIYLFEKQIKNAFRHIEIAYDAFMVGFGLVVLAFIFINVRALL